MMKRNENAYPITIGTSLLMVTLLVLALFTFAAISLTTARRDYKSSLTDSQRCSSYYTAANAAEEELDRLSAQAPDPARAGGAVQYQVMIDDQQAIAVSLRYDENGKCCQVEEWRTVNTTTWEGTSIYHVLQGNQ